MNGVFCGPREEIYKTETRAGRVRILFSANREIFLRGRRRHWSEAQMSYFTILLLLLFYLRRHVVSAAAEEAVGERLYRI